MQDDFFEKMMSGDDAYGRSNRGAANNQSVANPPKGKNLGYASGAYNPPSKIPAIGTTQAIASGNDQHDHMFQSQSAG